MSSPIESLNNYSHTCITKIHIREEEKWMSASKIEGTAFSEKNKEIYQKGQKILIQFEDYLEAQTRGSRSQRICMQYLETTAAWWGKAIKESQKLEEDMKAHPEKYAAIADRKAYYEKKLAEEIEYKKHPETKPVKKAPFKNRNGSPAIVEYKKPRMEVDVRGRDGTTRAVIVERKKKDEPI